MPTAPSPDDDTRVLAAVLAILFKLRVRSEAHFLALLLSHNYRSNEELRTSVVPATTYAAVKVHMHQLRQKLAPYDIKIIHVSKLGYALQPDARARVRARLAELPMPPVLLAPKAIAKKEPGRGRRVTAADTARAPP